MENRERMKTFIRRKCVMKGFFELSGGLASELYFDMKNALLDAEFVFDFKTIMGGYDIEAETIGGYGTGAALMMPLLSLCSGLNGLLVRDEKPHGSGKVVEGDVSSPGKILIVDDVLTTGGSVGKAMRELNKIGYDPIGVFVLVNRMKRGASPFDIPVNYLFHEDEL